MMVNANDPGVSSRQHRVASELACLTRLAAEQQLAERDRDDRPLGLAGDDEQRLGGDCHGGIGAVRHPAPPRTRLEWPHRVRSHTQTCHTPRQRLAKGEISSDQPVWRGRKSWAGLLLALGAAFASTTV